MSSETGSRRVRKEFIMQLLEADTEAFQNFDYFTSTKCLFIRGFESKYILILDIRRSAKELRRIIRGFIPK